MIQNNCPKCQERLRVEPYRNKEYLICFYCEGTWVNRSELDTHLVINSLRPSQKGTGLKCPCCVDKPLHHADVEGIELDYCLSCYGIFFDKGELEAVSPDFKNINGKEVAVDAANALAVIITVSRAIKSFYKVINGE